MMVILCILGVFLSLTVLCGFFLCKCNICKGTKSKVHTPQGVVSLLALHVIFKLILKSSTFVTSFEQQCRHFPCTMYLGHLGPRWHKKVEARQIPFQLLAGSKCIDSVPRGAAFGCSFLLKGNSGANRWSKDTFLKTLGCNLPWSIWYLCQLELTAMSSRVSLVVIRGLDQNVATIATSHLILKYHW